MHRYIRRCKWLYGVSGNARNAGLGGVVLGGVLIGWDGSVPKEPLVKLSKVAIKIPQHKSTTKDNQCTGMSEDVNGLESVAIQMP